MKKFEGILFCTDLDGTLYTSNSEVSKENLAAIEYFKSEGGLFTLNTGRVPKISVDIYNTIRPNAPYGCVNGAGIYDPLQEKYLWTKTLPDDVLELVKCVDVHLPEIGIQFNTEREIYFSKDNRAMELWRRATGVENMTCGLEELHEPLLKIVFAHLEGVQIQALMDLLDRHPRAKEFDFIRSERMLYEILPKGVSKGGALVKLAELLGIDLHRTIAVGDYNNDISMLQKAGLSFAVANAVDAAKAAADHVTVGNNEHAIAAIIDGLDRKVFTV